MKNSKNSKTSGGVCKMPAGTPKSANTNTNGNSKSSGNSNSNSNAKASQASDSSDTDSHDAGFQGANTPEQNTPKSVTEDGTEDAPDGSGGRVQNPPVPNRARTPM